jgi:hypothetical protein
MAENRGKAAASLANLRPFQPGQSGNPRGRPKSLFGKAIRKVMPEADLAEIIGAKCRRGDSKVIVAMLDRYDPRPDIAVKLEATGAQGDPLIPQPMVVASLDLAKAIGIALAGSGAAVVPKRLNGGANGHGSNGHGGEGEARS